MKVYTANITTNKGFTNGMTGRANSKATAFVNEDGQYAFLPELDENDNEIIPEQPYMPLGGRKSWEYVKDVVLFQDYRFDSAIVKRGREV